MKLWGSFALCLILAVSCARPQPDHVAMPVPTPAPRLPSAATVRPAEIRAVWVSNTDRLDWDSATRDLHRAGFNTMYVNFASGGAAFYPSRLVPNIAGNDAIATGVSLAHHRGLQVHAKLIVTFMFKTTPEFQKRFLATDRVMRGPTGKPIEQAGYYWLCPTHESNHTLLTGIVTEMLNRYPVDGLQYDYLRFCEQPSCYCDTCRHEFERTTGQRVAHWPRDVMEGPLTLRFKSWQRATINSLINELSTVARQTRPGIIVSSAVFSDLNRAREEKAQDWQAWLQARFVDYVCTMTYTPNRPEFESLVRKQGAWAGSSRRVVVGIGSWKMNDQASIHAQIAIARQLGNYGFSLFSYDDAAERNFLPDLSARN
jgi:uncharacterized lipoprotein YddW (UPF0748 family)